MLKAGGKTLGLDIGSSYIKWIVYRGSTRSPVIFNCGYVPTPAGAVRYGKIIKEDDLREKLREILEINKLKINKASITLLCPKMIIRTMELPPLKPGEMEQVVKHEMEQFISFNVEEYIVDYKILGQVYIKGSKLNRIMLVATPANRIQPYINLLEDLDMEPVIVDFHSNCASRFLCRCQPDLNDCNFALIDIGSTTTTVTIIEKDVPVFTRTIKKGSDEITGSSTDLYDFSDIYRSLEFYRDKNNKTIHSVMLIGGGSYLKDLDNFLVHQHNLPKHSIIKNAPVKLLKSIPAGQLALFVNVMGLTLRGER